MRWVSLIAVSFICLRAQKIPSVENTNSCNVHLSREVKKSFGYPEDAYLNVSEIIVKYGYPMEEYEVVTGDGYIITVVRIPRGKRRSKRQPGPPVLMVHGMSDSIATWVLAGPGYSLAYLLADAGYDVWLGGFRGGRYSRRHVSLDPDRDPKFWQYSSEEMGAYDVPALIDRVLNETGKPSLSYVGHSLGCRIFFEMSGFTMDMYPRVNSMSCLGPAVYVGNLFHPVMRMLSDSIVELEVLAKAFGVQEMFGSNSVVTQLIQVLCASRQFLNRVLQQQICSNLLFLIVGDDYDQLRHDLLPVITGHVPNGISLKMYVLFAQSIKSKKFQRYDYGVEENSKKYGSFRPPEYNISKVTTPVSIMIGKNDWLSSLQDAEMLRKQLPNVFEYFVIPHSKWHHADYIWARDAPRVVGDRILRMLKKYANT